MSKSEYRTPNIEHRISKWLRVQFPNFIIRYSIFDIRYSVVTIRALLISSALASAGCLFYQPIEPSLVWHPFKATAYCDDGFTASGVFVRDGIVAGDPRVLPLGSVIDVKVDGEVLTRREVMDTGGKIKGYIIDIWMDSCEEAVQFGFRDVRVRVRSLGSRT